MADPDLQNVLSQISFTKIVSEAYSMLAIAIGKAASNLWLTSRTTIVYLILFILVKKFYERGIGGLACIIIYLISALLLILIFGWVIIFNSWFEFLSLFSFVATKILLKSIGVWKY